MWYTDVISFVIDNSETAIICNQRRLSKGPLIPMLVALETGEELTTTIKLVGSMKLILTDDANKHHSYIITCCVFDSKTPVDVLGVPYLGTLFGDNSDATDSLAEDGTTIKSGSTKSHFIWDHDRHESHFMHGSIQMPEISICRSWLFHGYLHQST